MKFLNEFELKMFLIESGNTAMLADVSMETFQPTVEMLEKVFIQRQERKKGLLDFRKSKDTESQWRANRYKMLRGIRRFHNSTEGKRQHRQLARFLATRDTRPEAGGILAVAERSSLITEIDNYVQGMKDFFEGYYHPIDDHFEFITIRKIMSEVCTGVIGGLLSRDEMSEFYSDFMCDLVEASNIIKYLSDESGKAEQEISELWDESKKELEKTTSINDPKFYPVLTSILKKKLSIDKD
jgi:hypothetical protein